MSDKMREVPPITDETYKALMVALGMPNNRSLLSALQQIANHATQRAAWQAAQAEQSVPVVGEVVEWQYRWLNPEEFTGQPASLLEWQRVIPYPSQSNEKRLEELLAYRSHGKACYEIRALIVQPTHSITTAELERMRKDAEQVQFPSCTTCVNRGRVNGLSQETYCDWCLWQGQGYRVNHYAPQPKKEGK